MISDITVTNEFLQFSRLVGEVSIPSLRLHKAHIISIEVDPDKIYKDGWGSRERHCTCEIEIRTIKDVYIIIVRIEKPTKVGVDPLDPTNNLFPCLLQKLFKIDHLPQSTETTKDPEAPCEDLLSIEAPQ